jgi:glutamate-5-semialdehyde dehydrogenase
MSADIRALAKQARVAARRLAITSGATRDAALEAIAKALEDHQDEILAANHEDLTAGATLVTQGELTEPLLGRLNLGGAKYPRTVEMVRSVIKQPDPLGRTQSATEIDINLQLYRISVPIGVIGVIFESRPDALVQIASLCLKSGNAVLLKGGREANRTNRKLAQVIQAATAQMEDIPNGWISLLETREDVRALLELDDHLDLIIPRGGNEFVRYIMDNTRIPVMGHADGLCHVYVDRAADLDKAVRVAVDAKIQGVTTCCAAETLLVHQDIAEAYLAKAVPALRANNVELRGDARSLKYGNGQLTPATEADWRTEYLDYIYSIRVVDGLEAAINHINEYGSHHTDAILTEDQQAANRFLHGVDSASVYHNASTRFADGFRYGLGAEVGISTNRIHSRGPVGLEGLTIYKYILQGDGQTVDDYEGDIPKAYTHRPLDTVWQG